MHERELTDTPSMFWLQNSISSSPSTKAQNSAQATLACSEATCLKNSLARSTQHCDLKQTNKQNPPPYTPFF